MNTEDLRTIVSIIIPCYNSEQWIAEAIGSCLHQTYSPLEIIIIDDGSTDDSLQIVRQYAAQYPASIFYETGPNRGGCAARNRGLALATGDYVLFLDADDLLEPETIAGQVAAADGRKNVVVASPWRFLQWTGKSWLEIAAPAGHIGDPLVAELRHGDYIPVQALLWPRDLVIALGGWDESLWANQDGDLRLRARLAGCEFVTSAQGGFIYRRYSSNTVSGKPTYRALESKIRVFEKVEEQLRQSDRLEQYKIDLACAFHRLATAAMTQNEELGDRALAHALRLGGRRSVHGTFKHRLLYYTIGLKRKERVVRWLTTTPVARMLGRSQLSVFRDK